MASSRYLRLTASLVAVGILAIPGAAEAKTHRFPPATDVAVSFGLAKPRASGTLIRFVRNGVSLTRNRNGALTLRTSGRHTRHIAARGRRRPRVVIALSTITGRAKLSVGRRAVSISGRFAVEKAVTVRRGSRAGRRTDHNRPTQVDCSRRVRAGRAGPLGFACAEHATALRA